MQLETAIQFRESAEDAFIKLMDRIVKGESGLGRVQGAHLSNRWTQLRKVKAVFEEYRCQRVYLKNFNASE